MHLFHVLCSRHQQGSHDRAPDHVTEMTNLERALSSLQVISAGVAGVGPAGVSNTQRKDLSSLRAN